ncbi:hypothetical protein [Brachybacterium sacelli]|uniref:Uncharacterized protein n=1 Tax=Brachybacterium sacelli TaxID=173364 RepID=A0ABS4X5U7_9MICO|nr:hypothetical protein [Brachybacterium sacelli]MBP2383731.1 hypothetical protein [Brachybacterium sacelli]
MSMASYAEEAFDPVVLNLSGASDYYFVTSALEVFNTGAEGEIADEFQECLDSTSMWSTRELRQDHVDRAKRMPTDVDWQANANSEAVVRIGRHLGASRYARCSSWL